jgi:hypothetical protein
VNLVNGSASFTIPANSFPLGTGGIGATYSGDSVYRSAIGDAQINVVSSGTIQPTVTVTAPSGIVGRSFSTTVTVRGPNGDPVPTGLVWISISASGSGEQFSEQLTNGSVTFTPDNPDYVYSGPNTITVKYLGDSNYTSGSASTTVDVIEWATMTVTPYEPTIVVNQPLNLTVALTAANNYPTPTGTVTLSSGTYTSSAVQLTAGSASFTIPANSLAVGSSSVPYTFLTISYSGDSNYQGFSSNMDVIVTAIPVPGLTISGTAVSVAPGATTGNTSTITLTPSGGFTGNVALTAVIATNPAGAVDLPTLSFGTTTPVSITGAAAGTATLTITTTAATTCSALVHPKLSGEPWFAAGAATLACLLLFGIPARRRSWRTMLGALALLVALSYGVLACGGGGSASSGGGGGGGGGGNNCTSDPGTTAGTYTITVTGTSSSTTATGTVTLIVQ